MKINYLFFLCTTAFFANIKEEYNSTNKRSNEHSDNAMLLASGPARQAQAPQPIQAPVLLQPKQEEQKPYVATPESEIISSCKAKGSSTEIFQCAAKMCTSPQTGIDYKCYENVTLAIRSMYFEHLGCALSKARLSFAGSLPVDIYIEGLCSKAVTNTKYSEFKITKEECIAASKKYDSSCSVPDPLSP
jgi:hypothetical protein